MRGLLLRTPSPPPPPAFLFLINLLNPPHAHETFVFPCLCFLSQLEVPRQRHHVMEGHDSVGGVARIVRVLVVVETKSIRPPRGKYDSTVFIYTPPFNKSENP